MSSSPPRKRPRDQVRVAVIVPFRDEHAEQRRAAQLTQFVAHMREMNSGVETRVFVMEQSKDGKLFNRGMLLNAGFKAAVKRGYNLFIFHDVDLLPGADMIPWYSSAPESGTAIHIAACWGRYEGSSYFGGVVAFNKTDYEKINGFPNDYWGWGGEDDEMMRRVNACKIQVIKVNEGTLTDLEAMDMQTKLGYLKSKKLKNMSKWELRDKHKATWEINGLSNLNVKVKETLLEDEFCSHTVVELSPKFRYTDRLPRCEPPMSIWERKDIQKNAVLQQIFKDSAVLDQDGKLIKFHSGVSPLEGFHLYDVIRQNDCLNCLEVGMAYGTSGLYMCQALADNGNNGKLYSLDPNQSTQWQSIGRLNIERAGLLQHHELIEATSYIALPRLLGEVESNTRSAFDLVFVDGMHLFDYTLVDVFYAFKLLRMGGCLVVDDIKHDGVKRCITYIQTNYAGLLELVPRTPCSSSAGTFIKIGDDKRAWNFHKAF